MNLNKDKIVLLDVRTTKKILNDKNSNKYNNLRFLTYDTMKNKKTNNNEGKRKMTTKKRKSAGKKNTTGKKAKNAYTLNQIGDALFNFINVTNEQFKKIDNQFKKVDEQFKEVNEQFKKVDTKFDELSNQISGVNKRLNYIVKANKLKDSPQKEIKSNKLI